MKKNRIYRIIKRLLIIASIPFLLFWVLIVLLYIPPVQKFAVDTICSEVNESTGYDISIGSIHLAFPLKLNVSGFSMSRNDTLYAQSDRASVNISFYPLLRGQIELNYISLEHLQVDTKELIPGIAIEGQIGYFRTAARNIDFSKEIANIRQIHLHGAHVNIKLGNIAETEEDEEENTPAAWVINLRKGTIRNSSFSISIPGDTLSTNVDLGKLSLRRVRVNLGEETYKAKSLEILNSRVKYDKGMLSREDAPLDHIDIRDINLNCGNFEMTPAHTQIDINDFTLAQPQGISIAKTQASVYCDSTSLEVKQLSISSKNGTSVDISGSLPWPVLANDSASQLDAGISLSLNKKDLGALITKEQYDGLFLFQENMFTAFTKVRGNMRHLNIDTLNVDIPALTSIGANGHLENLDNADRIAALLKLDAHADDVRRLIALTAEKDSCDSINGTAPEPIFTAMATESVPGDSGRIDITGIAEYDAKVAQANIVITAAGGEIKAKALYDLNKDAYNADIAATDLNITRILPALPLERAGLHLTANGEGIDIFSDSTAYDIVLAIDTLEYGNISVGDITLDANQANSLSNIAITSNDPNLNLTIDAQTELHDNDIKNSTNIHIGKIDFGKLHLTQADLGTSLDLELGLKTDLDEKHAIKLHGKNINILTPIKTFTPEDIKFDFYTAPDSSSIIADNGDLRISGGMDSGYNSLFSSIEKVSAMFVDALKHDNTVHYMQDYQELLPKLNFSFICGRNNMLANFMAMNNITANMMRVNIDMDTIRGLNLRGGIYGLKTGELNLDTVRMFTRQEGNKIRYFAGVRSTSLNPQNEKQTYNAALFGSLTNDTLSTNFTFRNKAEEIAVRFGANTILSPYGLNMSFKPKAVFLNEDFLFDEGNYIKLGKGLSVDANVTLSNTKGTGLHLYTNSDPHSKYNANLELFKIDLHELTSIIPYSPDIAGQLNLDMHFALGDSGMLLSADAMADSLTYEGVFIGNEIIEAAYFPKGGDTHYIDLQLLHNNEDVAHLTGNYKDSEDESGLDGEITLTHFPLSVSRVFLQDAGFNLDGFINGNMSAKGKLNHLNTNGHIRFESVNIDAYGFGTNLSMPDETVQIENNKLMFNDFSIYAMGKNPFRINGDADFTVLMNPKFNLRMNADNYELVNSVRKKGSMFYGKLFVDARAMIGGSLDNIRLYGNVTMKSKSNLTYVMLDAPIESDKELDGLVEFVNFNDTTAVEAEEQEIDLGNMNLNLNLTIDDGARLNADLDEGRNNYITTEGSGNLHLTYTSEAGINVSGRYTMRNGEFKLNLPVIPLKTLYISEGSEVSWSGPLLDPQLDITALERVSSSVTFEDNSTESVLFDVGVKVSNTLDNMGLSFVMSSPENPTIQEQLNALDTETMNRYAVTMMLTGAYAGSNKGMTVSNALNSFLDAKINDIAGTAMRSMSVNVGINDVTNAETGNSYKNYSFSFSKRFWNDRVTLNVGGEVNSGDAPERSNSFINNASIEWKVSESGNRFLKLFYDKNYESILEGEITETGLGYVYKRKLSKLKELFSFSTKKKKEEEKKKTEQESRARINRPDEKNDSTPAKEKKETER